MDISQPGAGPNQGETVARSSFPEPNGREAERGGESKSPLAAMAVRGGMWAALGTHFSLGLGFLANLVLVRLLSPEDFGVFALAAALFAFLDLGPKMGLRAAAGQRKENSGELVGTFFALNAAASLATLILVLACLPVFHLLGYPSSVLWVVAALGLIAAANSVTGAASLILDRSLKFKTASLAVMAALPLSYLPAFWLALTGAGYWALVVQNAVNASLLLPLTWWMARRAEPEVFRLYWKFDWTLGKKLLKFGLVVGLTAAAGTLLAHADNLMVGSMIGLAALGIYDRAYRTSHWPNMLLCSVTSRAAFFTYAKIQDQNERLSKAFNLLLWLTLAAALPLALAVFAAADEIISFLFGAKWLPAVPFIRVLVFFALWRPVLENTGSLFTAVGRPRLNTLASFTEALVLIVFGPFFVLKSGIMGACLAVGLAFVTGLVLRLGLASRLIRIGLFENMLRPVLAAALALAVIQTAMTWLNAPPWPVPVLLALKAGGAVLLFAGLLLVIQGRTTLNRLSYLTGLLWGQEREATL